MKLVPTLAAALLAGLAPAQIGVLPGLSFGGQLTLSNLGVLPFPSAIQFSADGNTLFVSGSGNYPTAVLYALPVFRQANNEIVGFGDAVEYALTPYIDAGLEFGPNGVLFFTEYPTNVLGELVNGTLYEFPLPPETNSTGGVTFVPAGNPNAGTMLISNYLSGDIWSVALLPNLDGSFTPGAATLYAAVPGVQSEAICFVPAGPMAGDLLLADFLLGDAHVRRFRIDHTTGLPVGGPASPVFEDVITNLPEQDGMAFDPITTELFLTDWYQMALFRFPGFATMAPLTASSPELPVGGGAINFTERAGTANTLALSILAASITGTSPGTPFGSIVVPLNVDFLTVATFTMANTRMFTNFQLWLNPTGEGLSTLNVPAGLIPPALVGTQIDFAYFVLGGAQDFASNAVRLTIVN